MRFIPLMCLVILPTLGLSSAPMSFLDEIYVSSTVTVPDDLNERYPNVGDSWSAYDHDSITKTHRFTVLGGTGVAHLWFEAFAFAVDDNHIFDHLELWMASLIRAGPIEIVPLYHTRQSVTHCYGLTCGTIPFTYGEPLEVTFHLESRAGYGWRRNLPQYCSPANCDPVYAGVVITSEAYIRHVGVWAQDPTTFEWIENENAVISFATVPEPGPFFPTLIGAGAVLLWRRRSTTV